MLGIAGGLFQKACFGATLHHVCFLLLSAPPPGAAASAAAAEFRQASVGATLFHFCLLLLSALPPGVPAGAELREASLGATLFHFCSLLLSALLRLGLLLVLPVLNSEKLVLEQHSFTFAHFCCPRPTPGAAASVAGADFREASFGATLFHLCSLLLSEIFKC